MIVLNPGEYFCWHVKLCALPFENNWPCINFFTLVAFVCRWCARTVKRRRSTLQTRRFRDFGLRYKKKQFYLLLSTSLVQTTQKFASFLFPWSSSFHLLFHTSSISLFSITFWPAKKLIVAKMCAQARLFTDFVT